MYHTFIGEILKHTNTFPRSVTSKANDAYFISKSSYMSQGRNVFFFALNRPFMVDKKTVIGGGTINLDFLKLKSSSNNLKKTKEMFNSKFCLCCFLDECYQNG